MSRVAHVQQMDLKLFFRGEHLLRSVGPMHGFMSYEDYGCMDIEKKNQ